MQLFPPTVTRTVTSSEATEQIDELLSFAANEPGHRVVVERDGTPVAALISIADLERFDRLLAARERRFDVLKQVGQAFADASDEEVEREAIKAIAEIRAEAREKREQMATMRQ